MISEPMKEKITCLECQKEFEAELIALNGRTVFRPRYCEPCSEKLIARKNHDAQRRAKGASHARFATMIPPIYLTTDKNRLLPVLRSAINSWEFSPVGMGFVGASGKGKTRAAVELLKKQHELGKDVFYLSATDLALNSANQFADNPAIKEIAKSILSLCRRSDVLLLDDLGKGRMTDRAESELYDLLEYRTSRRLPTIWTSNSDGQQLRSMLSADRGEAITRRLGKEFTNIIKL